jgi:hypothetical protein
MNAKIVASNLSLQNTLLDNDIIYEIVERLNNMNNAKKNWNRIQNKIYFIVNRENISDLAHMIHKEGHVIHYIAREFHTLSENKIALLIHKVGAYYHLIGKKILDILLINYKNIPSKYFI